MSESGAQPTKETETRVRAEQVDALYSKGLVAFLTVIVNSSVVAYVLWPDVDHGRISPWLAAVYAVTIPRVVLHAAYRRSARARVPDDATFWGRAFTLGTAANGVVWGAGGYLLYAPASLGAQTLLLFVLGGMCAGAASSTATYAPAFPAFTVPAIAPIVVQLVRSDDRLHWAMAAMLTLFAVAMTTIARTGGRHLTDSVRLRFKNDALVLGLAEARDHLEERVKARTAEVLAQKELLQKVFDYSPVMLQVCDADGKAQRLNRAMEERLGFSLEEYERESVRALVFAGADGHSSASRDVESTAKTGKRLYTTWATARLSDGMTIRIGQDVTERKRAEEAVAMSQRLTSVGALAAGVAHEINNPLAFLLANQSFLRERLLALGEELASDPRVPRTTVLSMREALEALADAQTGAERVRRIVLDMRALSYGDDGALRAVSLPEVLETSLRMVQGQLTARARLHVEVGETPRVTVTASRLEQVFVNVLLNAVQAMPPDEADRHEVRVTSRTDASGWAVVEIGDDGRGIPPDDLPRIFDPFFTTKPLGHGAGLGLAIVHGIVKGAGGEIAITSDLGRGTAVTISLPPAVSA